MLLASIDLGSSLIKSFFLNQGHIQPLTIHPQTAPLSHLPEASYKGLGDGGNPESTAWVQAGGETVAVGQLASNFVPDVGLTEDKTSRASMRVLATLGVMRERSEEPATLPVKLILSLPMSEYKKKDYLKSTLEDYAGNFVFRDQHLSMSFKHLQFIPEGTGLFLCHKAQLQKQGGDIRNRTVIVLMFGHRNLSLLAFQNGVLQGGLSNSNGPGFFKAAVEIGANTQGIRGEDHERLTEAMVFRKPKMRQHGHLKLVDCAEAVEAGLSSYWSQAQSYLTNTLTPLVSENCDLIISGGPAWVIRDQLTTLFEEMGLADRMVFGGGLQEQLKDIFRAYPQFQQNNLLGLRMADPFGAFGALLSMEQKLQQPQAV